MTFTSTEDLTWHSQVETYNMTFTLQVDLFVDMTFMSRSDGPNQNLSHLRDTGSGSWSISSACIQDLDLDPHRLPDTWSGSGSESAVFRLVFRQLSCFKKKYDFKLLFNFNRFCGSILIIPEIDDGGGEEGERGGGGHRQDGGEGRGQVHNIGGDWEHD